ncbi:carbon-nitrogen hydrolase family protein [Corynebacterium epidermidicanis]|uniref:Putative amidohydrolase n=1 Tax=Corynebacterium epidermidicanis TaxID=1050174 RepID=A0A0G3GLW6_9CORY|nr:carbon-nitrogen hydrolase family protein [Corynebacterium epidermidicanis]AKK02191.1 putative amidohydrolase [Corynebacterium epidermidicanis]
MKIALVQMLSQADKLENLAAVEKWTLQAAELGAELIVFPEATMKAFQSGRLDTVAEPIDGPWANKVRELAQELGVTIVVGMFCPADQRGDKNRVTNTLLVTGGADAKYDKIHTYDAFGYRESDTVRAGDEIVVFQLDGRTIGVATCYDIRFPEQFKELARRGAELIVVPASWADGADKLRQWRLLTNARGLDSTSFIAAVGQARPPASEGGPTGIGHSALISPTGERLVEAGYDEELLVVDIDFDQVAEARRALPVIEG